MPTDMMSPIATTVSNSMLLLFFLIIFCSFFASSFLCSSVACSERSGYSNTCLDMGMYISV